MKLVSYYLSRCGDREHDEPARPPRALSVTSWKDAYDLFYDSLGDGRKLSQFRNSLKNARDSFDILFDNGRVGWIGTDTQDSPLSASFMAIHEEWDIRSDEDLETFAFGLISKTHSIDNRLTFAHEARTEGGEKVFVATRPERDPKLRLMAIEHHGYDCMACNFNFERFYGEIGKNFIEVHHVVPLSDVGERETNPETDLIVLCANCHRMVHRRKGICLSLDELARHLRDY